MEEIKSKWGGRREGSGRKDTGRKPRSITATDEEWNAIKELAEQAGKDVSRFVVESILKK
ncbi:MAG: hypothetical protein ACTTJ1_08760 [Treponema sp.]